MFIVSMALLTFGIFLVLLEPFSYWKLWRHGPYNNNVMYQVILNLTFWPTRIVLPLAVSLLFFHYAGRLSWQLPIVVACSVVVTWYLVSSLSIMVTHPYRKREEERERLYRERLEKEEINPPARSAQNKTRVKAVLTTMDGEEVLRRKQATVRRPSQL